MSYSVLIKPGTQADLQNIDPNADGNMDKAKGRQKLEKLMPEIQELQELMYAAKNLGLLIVFQGMDTSGKDGAINKAHSYLNVQSCRTCAFKVPTPDELAHDFLWRIHKETPGKGGVTIFNRSHYEDVLTVRVHELVASKIWKARYDHINAFESLIAQSNTLILKFYLHISKREQEERLNAREADPMKAWKLSLNDWKERELWDKYMLAYEDAVTKCSTKAAPWRVIPANHKWFRDLAVAEAVLEALQPFKEEWQSTLADLGKEATGEIEAYRASTRASAKPRPKGQD